MSNKELAKQLIDEIPEHKLLYIIPYLEGAAIPDEIPNTETLEAIQEIESGGGVTFLGSASELFQEILED